MSKNGFRKLLNDIKNNGIANKLINFVPIAGDNFVLFGNNRLMAPRQLGLTDQLNFEEVELPFRGFQTEEDVINAASEFESGGSCMY